MDFEVIRDGVDDAKPLLYQWEIHDSRTGDLLARYIGKAVRGSKRPLRHYERNVRRLIAGMAYRKSKPDGFRRLHRWRLLGDMPREGCAFSCSERT